MTAASKTRNYDYSGDARREYTIPDSSPAHLEQTKLLDRTYRTQRCANHRDMFPALAEIWRKTAEIPPRRRDRARMPPARKLPRCNQRPKPPPSATIASSPRCSNPGGKHQAMSPSSQSRETTTGTWATLARRLGAKGRVARTPHPHILESGKPGVVTPGKQVVGGPRQTNRRTFLWPSVDHASIPRAGAPLYQLQ